MSYNFSMKKARIRQKIKNAYLQVLDNVSQTLTQVFSGGLTAEKSAGSTKDLSKLSSTLHHLLTTSERAIASGESLVGSCVPSYLKVGCFRH